MVTIAALLDTNPVDIKMFAGFASDSLRTRRDQVRIRWEGNSSYSYYFDFQIIFDPLHFQILKVYYKLQ